MKTLKEFLETLDTPIGCIEVRTNSPAEDEEDMLFGYCSWDGEKIGSLDGDSYEDDLRIYRWEYPPKETNVGLTVWVKSEWKTGPELTHNKLKKETAKALETLEPLVHRLRNTVSDILLNGAGFGRTTEDCRMIEKNYLMAEDLYLRLLKEEQNT